MGFVTRIRDNAVYSVIENLNIDKDTPSSVLEDTIIEVSFKDENKNIVKFKLRKVRFYDQKLQREFEFLTNLFEMKPDMIAAIYKTRWEIETLFKQLKQNFPLKYFLGDNENAIIIQIYCALIVNLLFTIIQKQLKRKWSFSNIVSFCRIHLFNYINLFSFLENPEKDWRKQDQNLEILTLF